MNEQTFQVKGGVLGEGGARRRIGFSPNAIIVGSNICSQESASISPSLQSLLRVFSAPHQANRGARPLFLRW